MKTESPNTSSDECRKPIEHDLKIRSRHYEPVISGKKKAEYSVNDRDFQVDDTLLLREVTEPDCKYTGRNVRVTVAHIIRVGEMNILSIELPNAKQYIAAAGAHNCHYKTALETAHKVLGAECDAMQRTAKQSIAVDGLVDPDMPTQQLRLHMGELTAQEVLVARAAIRWANTRRTATVDGVKGESGGE